MGAFCYLFYKFPNNAYEQRYMCLGSSLFLSLGDTKRVKFAQL